MIEGLTTPQVSSSGLSRGPIVPLAPEVAGQWTTGTLTGTTDGLVCISDVQTAWYASLRWSQLLVLSVIAVGSLLLLALFAIWIGPIHLGCSPPFAGSFPGHCQQFGSPLVGLDAMPREPWLYSIPVLTVMWIWLVRMVRNSKRTVE
jgi:hypothetical protein